MEKIFVLSMQRNGTSSVGDFLEKAGFSRIGHQLSNKLGWSRMWLNGDYDAIFDSKEFKENQVFEDDPFWFPDFYKYLYHKFPNSKFILMDRDSDAWFKSMISHSRGYSLGQTDIHARVYDREDELNWLKTNISNFNPKKPQGMVIFDKAIHYKNRYELYNSDVKSFFKGRPEKFFYSRLSDKNKWLNMLEFLSIKDESLIDILMSSETHAHKTKAPLNQEGLLK